MDWFTIEPVDGGLSWKGRCWYVHNLIKYEFDFRFDIPATYPAVAPEIELPELDGKTAKMYRGGKICLTIHFKPLWAKNWCVAGRRGGAWGCGRACHNRQRDAQRGIEYSLVLLLPFCSRSPRFGIAHALCLGLAPWLAAEIPHMVETGVITAKV
jgi:ufm1-conjugating enzyme 1